MVTVERPRDAERLEGGVSSDLDVGRIAHQRKLEIATAAGSPARDERPAQQRPSQSPARAEEAENPRSLQAVCAGEAAISRSSRFLEFRGGPPYGASVTTASVIAPAVSLAAA